MTPRRILISLATLAVCVGAVVFISNRGTPPVRAEKAVRVLRSRLQQFADTNGHVPRDVDDLQPIEVIHALRSQVEGAGYQLLWIPADEQHGFIIATRRGGDVSAAWLARVEAPRSSK